MGYEVVDLKSSPRAYGYNKFVNAKNPMMTMTCKVDITRLYRYSKKNHRLNALLMYCIMKAASKNENFYLDVKDKTLIKYDSICVNLVLKAKDNNLYYVSVEDFDTFNEFEKKYIEVVDECYQKCTHRILEGRALIATSAIVNSTFETIVAAYDDDFLSPFFTWGRFEKKWNKVVLNISLRFHHAFMDGLDVGEFFNNLKEEIKKFR